MTRLYLTVDKLPQFTDNEIIKVEFLPGKRAPGRTGLGKIKSAHKKRNKKKLKSE